MLNGFVRTLIFWNKALVSKPRNSTDHHLRLFLRDPLCMWSVLKLPWVPWHISSSECTTDWRTAHIPALAFNHFQEPHCVQWNRPWLRWSFRQMSRVYIRNPCLQKFCCGDIMVSRKKILTVIATLICLSFVAMAFLLYTITTAMLNSDNRYLKSKRFMRLCVMCPIVHSKQGWSRKRGVRSCTCVLVLWSAFRKNCLWILQRILFSQLHCPDEAEWSKLQGRNH